MSDPRDLLARDETARGQSQQEFARPLVIEAGAGTGKTTTLVARVVVWCLGPGWERAAAQTGPGDVGSRVLQGIVAITFTDAAAAEMAARIGTALYEIEAGRVPEGIHERLLPDDAELRKARARALLGAIDRIVVLTIHAFCRRLLAGHPLDAGLHPRFELDGDGDRREEVLREAVEVALQEGYADPGDPDYLALAREQIGPREIAEALEALVAAGVPASGLAEAPFAPERVASFRASLAQALEALERLSDSMDGTKTARSVAAALPRLVEALASAELSDVARFETFLELWQEIATPTVCKRLRAWGKDEFTKREDASLGPLREELRTASDRIVPALGLIEKLRPKLTETTSRVMSRLLETVERELRVRGIVTYPMLLECACALLEENPKLAARIRRGIDQLLVDEFQDTDPTQCRIIELLSLAGPPEQRPGLFIVGDPKQSIYGWRSADLRAYSRFREKIVEMGGEVHLLSRNFRSAGAILDEVEAVLDPVMIEDPEVQPPFEPLVPGEDPPGPFEEGGRAPVEYWIPCDFEEETQAPSDGTLFSDAAEIGARGLALDLRELHDEFGVRWSDVGVLFRTRGSVESYLGELRRSGVPYEIEGDRSYYRRREVVETAALVRCILDPNDQLALLTVLRSAFVGVPDAALIPLWTRNFLSRAAELHGSQNLEELGEIVRGAASEVRDIASEVPGLARLAGWEQNLISALSSIGRLRSDFESEAPDRFVENLRRHFLMEATEAARYLGNYRLANLELFFDTLIRDLGNSGGDARVLLRGLRRRIAEASEQEEARPREGGTDAVRICTIHQAKGLEFEHVYLMELHRRRPPRSSEFVAGRVEQSLEYRIFGAPTLGVAALESRQAAVEKAERVRSLYVAMTRAKRRLVLGGLWLAAGGRPSESARSHAELLPLRRSGAPDLHELAARAGPERGRVQDSGAQWAFPRLFPEAEAARQHADPQDSGLAPPAEIERDAARIAQARQVAAARMARPLSEAASRAAHLDAGDAPSDPLSRAGDGSGETGRSVALAVGTAVHRLMEGLDLGEALGPQLVEWRGTLEQALRRELHGPEAEAAVGEAHEILDRLEAGPLLERLGALGDRVIARELPVQLAPDPGSDGPVGFIAGAVDLVYRDPGTDEWVVADFKTDRVSTPDEIRERSESYASQGRSYTLALQRALGLEQEPRFELWFLRAGTIETGQVASA